MLARFCSGTAFYIIIFERIQTCGDTCMWLYKPTPAAHFDQSWQAIDVFQLACLFAAL